MKKKSSLDYANEISGENGMYDYLDNKSDNTRVEKIISLIGRGNKVLDVGCYDGMIGEKILKNNNIVYGIDGSEKAIKSANERGIIGAVCDLESELAFSDEYFDVIFAGEIIEHILDTELFLKELCRVLKKGGYLILTTPNAASIGRRLLLLFGMNPYFEASLNLEQKAAGHIRFFIRDLLVDFIERNGFKVVKFESDIFNFSSFYSKFLATMFPTLGKSLIIKAQKNKGLY